jgi:hypothetical protein
MATNENGNLVDTAGNVAVDFVWGNFPMQPNDERIENGGTVLDPALDNHEIAYQNWNGYPLVIDADNDSVLEGTAGPEGAGFIVVPSVLGETTAVASRVLVDDGLVVTTATAETNAAKTVTAASRTAGSTEVSITATGAVAAYPVGTKITVTNSGDATVNGTWTVTGNSSTNVVKFNGTATTVLALTGITGTVVGTAGTVKTQSVAAGANSIAVGAAITITPWAAAS